MQYTHLLVPACDGLCLPPESGGQAKERKVISGSASVCKETTFPLSCKFSLFERNHLTILVIEEMPFDCF